MSTENIEELIKSILKASINSAIGIDDEFVEPYDVVEKDSLIIKTSSALYDVFHRELNCTLSLLQYRGLSDFKERVSSLMNNKDLLLLDWQLRGEGIDALEDVATIVDHAVSQESPIRFIVIYTAVNDLYPLTRDLYVAFSDKDENGLEIESIKEEIDEILTNNQERLTIDDLEKVMTDNLQGILLPANRKAARKRINAEICRKLSQGESKQTLKKYAKQLDNVLVKLELSYASNTARTTRYSPRKVQVFEEDLLLIDNTAIFLVTKQGAGKQGFSPDQLVNHLCSKLKSLKNWRSLLLSFRFKEVLSNNLAIIGKGLGGFNDSVLGYHIDPMDSKTTIEYLVNCFNVHVSDILDKIDNSFLTKLWTKDNLKENCSPEELGQFVSFLSFSSLKVGEAHRISTGDIFTIKGLHLFQKEDEEEYLMCITQSCDCLRSSDKVNNNFAFAIGKNVSLTTALTDLQKGNYTIVKDNVAIQWENRFLTIHIPEKGLSFANSLSCVIVGINQEGDLDSKSVEMNYLGHQKEIYAQRVINGVFSHAMRVGIDLPEWRSS